MNTAKQSAADIKKYQEARLRETFEYLSANSPFYKKHFSENKIDISKITSLEDLQKIPTVTKDDFSKNNFDFLCVPKNKIADYTTTSGTTGAPVSVALTENDFGTDEILIHIALNGSLEVAEQKIKNSLQTKLRVIPSLNFISAQQLQTMRPAESRKPVTIVFR